MNEIEGNENSYNILESQQQHEIESGQYRILLHKDLWCLAFQSLIYKTIIKTSFNPVHKSRLAERLTR